MSHDGEPHGDPPWQWTAFVFCFYAPILFYLLCLESLWVLAWVAAPMVLMGLISKIKVSNKGVIRRYYLLRTPWFGVKLHYIHGSDDDWHTHPWNGFSIIFGKYIEEVETNEHDFEHFIWDDCLKMEIPSHITSRKYVRRWFNRIYAFKKHKVTIIKPVWTLFIHGKRRNENWQYGEAVAPWRGPDQT